MYVLCLLSRFGLHWSKRWWWRVVLSFLVPTSSFGSTSCFGRFWMNIHIWYVLVVVILTFLVLILFARGHLPLCPLVLLQFQLQEPSIGGQGGHRERWKTLAYYSRGWVTNSSGWLLPLWTSIYIHLQSFCIWCKFLLLLCSFSCLMPLTKPPTHLPYWRRLLAD
jgi:hypothetical protein